MPSLPFYTSSLAGMRKTKVTITLGIAALTPLLFAHPVLASEPTESKMVLIKTFTGSLSPKSVAASQNGLVSAHNMMYQHSVTIFDSRSLELITTVKDSVSLTSLGIPGFPGTFRGAPVEGAYSPDSQFLYFTNYAMYGKGFTKEGHDVCSPSSGFDTSYLSRINLVDYKIDAVYPVGSVPKVVSVTPDNKYVLVSNWCSYTVSVISVEKQKVIKTLKIGRYPRGIAISSDSRYAYVAEMGGNNIHRIDLTDFTKSLIPIGSNPRAIQLSPDDKTLYATLNISGKVVSWNLEKNKLVKSVKTGLSARSLALNGDGTTLFVVNFKSGTLTKLNTLDLSIIQTIKVCKEPIGVTYDNETERTWVACYEGSIKVFQN
jgi:YVTN family beta-propeller protein